MVAPILTTEDWKSHEGVIIDARSPAEFEDDHIPGAINLPVLDNEERAEVGRIYKEVSPFEARKLGARLAAVNIARHIEARLGAHDTNWRPLIYCWRGGQRSGSMARILAEIGWLVTVLDGGYKRYRKNVMDAIDQISPDLDLIILKGATGTAKTRILRSVQAVGGQVIDLEGLARHRGSLLGHEPGQEQPSQRFFETCLLDVMAGLDPARPVLIEAESSRIGSCHIPRMLWQRMQQSPQITITASRESRVEFLIRDYAHLINNPSGLDRLFDGMIQRHGREICESWRKLARNGQWHELVGALIEQHYDPAYANTGARRAGADLGEIRAEALTDAAMPSLAKKVLVRMEMSRD
ncbi:tRNA 2-selenouridine(34) synthase MnmH [Alphaproteobacteria bacterium LSUCC0684]